MNIGLTKQTTDSDLLILPIFSGQKIKDVEIPAKALADFKNVLGATLLIYSEAAGRVLLVGLGEKKNFHLAQLRTALHSALLLTKNLEIESASLVLTSSTLQTPKALEMIGFSLIYSSYKFDGYKKSAKPLNLQKIFIIGPVNQRLTKALETGIVIGTAANQARNLGNHPANIATPTHLAKHASDLARQYNFSCKVLGPKEITENKLGLLQAVGQGSNEPSKFIVLEYGPKSKPVIALIGKGVTFDSGGISIKPADKMEEMKYDMCGAATVLGIFEAAARLKLPVHLVGLIPAAENLVSGQAVKPGDVLQSFDGTTVEMINTDGEGRLILADAISYAKKHFNPKLMIDYATLTGAAIAALGDQYAAYFSNVKTYNRLFEQAATTTSEKFWPLPLAHEYQDQLKSMFADIKNVGEKNLAGATTAALFLEHFVGESPWIHLDTAPTAWTMRPKPYSSPGATAWGVYLTVDFLRNL